VLLRSAAAAVAVVALAGCGGSAKPAATTGASQLPPGCSAEQVDAIVTSFLARPQLAPAPFFQVYAAYDSDKRAFVSRSRARTLAHLSARKALGERDRLISLRVFTGDINHVRITFQLTRYAPDFRERGIHGRLSKGAGTVDCAHGKIAAWTMKGP
jgi:hypothetical protein